MSSTCVNTAKCVLHWNLWKCVLQVINPLRSETFTHFPAVLVRNYFASLWRCEEKHKLWKKNSKDIYFFYCILLATSLPIFRKRVIALETFSWVQARVVTAGFTEKHSFPPASACFSIATNCTVLAASAWQLVYEMALPI